MFDFFGDWLSSSSGVMGAILSALRTLCFWLMEIIYKLMVNTYNLFEKLCSTRLLDNVILEVFSQRIGLILGLVMFFYVIFSFIQMLVDPEKITNKETGAITIVKKAILVIIMLGVSNACFSLLYGVQKQIIKSNIIPKILLPYTVNDGDEEQDKFGNLLSASLITAFYYVEDMTEKINEEFTLKEDDADTLNNLNTCGSITNTFYDQIYNENRYDLGYNCLNQSIKVTRKPKYSNETYDDQMFMVNFNGILGVLVGGYTFYIILMYCFKVGVRMIQLAFLEIISPMAIISYMSPKKDNMFTKWLGIYSATYIDVFIRIAIINLIIFLISTIFSANGQEGFVFWDELGQTNSTEKTFITVIIVLALLTFAKKAPELLKELFPSSGKGLGFGIDSPKQFFSNMLGGKKLEAGLNRTVKGAYGAAAVGLSATVKNTRKALGNAIKNPKDLKSWGRVGGSLLFGGFGGFTRGLTTKDAAGRKRAAENAYAARQSMYKMRDLGYGAGLFDLFKTKEVDMVDENGNIVYDAMGNPRKVKKYDSSGWKAIGNKFADETYRKAFMMDQHIEDVADMKDLNIASMERQLLKAQDEYQGVVNGDGSITKYTISKSKSHNDMYLVDDGSGKAVLMNKTDALNKDPAAFAIAELQAQIGKARGDSKKLHQKAEEQKQKSGK